MRSGDRGLFTLLVDDGRPLITLTGICLALAGGFAIFQSLTGHFLPHDSAFLGLSPADLCAAGSCRIVDFMFHDRVAFGGTLIAVGALYIWLAALPLRDGEAWAWWILTASGLAGFASFLSYLGFGYLDTWHAVATLLLFPLFLAGLVLTKARLPGPSGIRSSIRHPTETSGHGLQRLGYALVITAALGATLAGGTILAIGTTTVFVPQDHAFMDLSIAQLDAVPRLIPLIAHDRAAFGGGLLTTGLAALGVAWCARPSRSAWQALAVAGLAGFGAAIGVHVAVGYTDVTHLGPAIIGASVLATGLALWRPEPGRLEGPS
jgi:hypothetical protein